MIDYSKFEDYGEYLEYCYEEQCRKIEAELKNQENDKQRKQSQEG